MKYITKLLPLILITLFLTGCGASKFQLDRAQQSYKIQNYRQAFLRLKPIAEAGNIDAQYALSYMYYYGQGVVENRVLAKKWMSKAASQGSFKAIKGLSMINK